MQKGYLFSFLKNYFFNKSRISVSNNSSFVGAGGGGGGAGASFFFVI